MFFPSPAPSHILPDLSGGLPAASMYDLGGPTLSMKGERRAVTANKDREEGKNGPSWVAARQMAPLPRDDTHFAQGVPHGIQSKDCTFIGLFRPFMAESLAAALMFTLFLH